MEEGRAGRTGVERAGGELADGRGAERRHDHGGRELCEGRELGERLGGGEAAATATTANHGEREHGGLYGLWGEQQGNSRALYYLAQPAKPSTKDSTSDDGGPKSAARPLAPPRHRTRPHRCPPCR